MADAAIYAASSPPQEDAHDETAPLTAYADTAPLQPLSHGHSHGGHDHGHGHSHSHEPPEAAALFHENIPREAPATRVVGQWVPPHERALREWYSVACKCGSEVMFTWLGCATIMCPTCGTHLSSEPAVVRDAPDVDVQRKAQEEEQRLQTLVNSFKKNDARAKRFVERFSWLRKRADGVERLLFGPPLRYGRFKMYRGGRIILSPTTSEGIFPPLIVLPALLALVGLGDANPFLRDTIFAVLVVSFAAITVAHFTEPGILRKGKSCPPQKDVYEEINGHPVVRKWCKTCHCLRSARASHCAECDVCVDRFDHHCHITGTCVGARNYRPFVVFVIGIAIADTLGLVAFCMRMFGWQVYGDWSAEQKGHKGWYVTVAVFGAIWTLIMGQVMVNMAMVTLYMMTRGVTTRELMKQLLVPDDHAFHRGSKWANFKEMAFGRTPPSLIWGLSKAELEALQDDDLT